MFEGGNLSIEDLDFIFQNEVVKVIAEVDSPEIKLTGLSVGPFEAQKEYEVVYWVAKELARRGIVRFRDADMLDITKLSRIHWAEKVQKPRQLTQLPKDFYPKLRRFLEELKEKAANNPEKIRDYMRADGMFKDIVNRRLRKIVLLASSLGKTNQLVLNNLTEEEKILYSKIRGAIESWRADILKTRS